MPLGAERLDTLARSRTKSRSLALRMHVRWDALVLRCLGSVDAAAATVLLSATAAMSVKAHRSAEVARRSCEHKAAAVGGRMEDGGGAPPSWAAERQTLVVEVGDRSGGMPA